MMHRRVSHAADPVAPVSPSATTPAKLRRRRRKRRELPPYPTNSLQVILQKVLVGLGVVVLVILVLAVSSRLLSSSNSGTARQLKNVIKPNRGEVVQDLEVLPWNEIYRIPESMEQVGDRSGHYAHLRHDTDAYLADEAHLQRHWQSIPQRSFVSRPMEMHNSDQVAYDIYNCPDTPPAGYPYAWKTLDILRDWPTDVTEPPTDDEGQNNNHLLYQSFCVFDYVKDYDKAITYRDASLPFVVVNDPNVAKTVVRWSLPDYMDLLLGTVPHRTEYSANNHFMYYIPPPKDKKRQLFGTRGGARDNNSNNNNRHVNTPQLTVPENWTEPTKMMRMSYHDWLQHANVSDAHTTRDDPHWYFRLIGCGAMGNDGSCDYGSSEYLFDELPYFQPKPGGLYVVDPDQQKGIHCRFGMKGVIAENHFDGSRNSIVVLKGSRRYILSHPDQCSNLALHPKGHPSARHSAVDWSNPDLEKYPEFTKAKSSEVVLQAGQVLYLPTNWFHYIVSLELNYQCNTRSGIEENLMPYVQACGF